MWKWILPAFIAIVITLVQACAPKPKSQESCNFVQNVYGERVSWKGNLPIVMQVHQSFPQEYLPALNEAVEIWEMALGRRLFDISPARAAGPIDPKQDRVSMIYWMKNWEADRTNEQGRTSVFWLGNTIQEADLRINARNFTFYVNGTGNLVSGDVELVSLLVHELGHVLGLKHNDETPSVMATYLASHTTRKLLAQEDVSSMQCEY